MKEVDYKDVLNLKTDKRLTTAFGVDRSVRAIQSETV